MTPFPRHRLRKIHALDGIWDFTFLGEIADLNSIDLSTIRFDKRIAVPSVFDMLPEWAGKRGTAAYRTRVEITPNLSSRLKFAGLGMWAQIFVDGQLLGEWALPYSGFTVDVPPAMNSSRELVVIVDNRFDFERVPLQQQFFDFYAYGGIFRSVEWHEVPPCSLDRVRIQTLDWTAGVILAEIKVHGNCQENIDFKVSINDGEEWIFENQFAGNGVIKLELRVPNPVPWSLQNPVLHTLRVSTEHDDIIERFGLRTVRVENGQILLNDVPQKLLGYCRHEAQPQFGPALPLQQLVHDLALLRDLGCNFIRGSHYPQDPRFLDLCDETGVLVMEESLGWGQNETHFQNQNFCQAQEHQTRLMVQNSFNHPCVIFWGFLNEGRSDKPESRALYQRLTDAIRQNDPTRPVTFASNHPFDDLNFDLADIICINTYPGWYAEDREKLAPTDEILPRLEKIIRSLDERGQGHKPLIISEIGAGAIYGWRDPLKAHWSEEYQAKYLTVTCEAIIQNARINGVALWQFCDCRTYASSFALGRPRGFNNKGTLDEYRLPKLAYACVKAIFNQFWKNNS